MAQNFDPTTKTKKRLLAIVTGVDKRYQSHLARVIADRELTKRGIDWIEE